MTGFGAGCELARQLGQCQVLVLVHHLFGQIEQGAQRFPTFSRLGTGRRFVAETKWDKNGPQQGDHICFGRQVVASGGLLHGPHRLPDL